MKNFRSNLPPLDYLLFFEAVARHSNFTRAAEELNVSQAAVSKRVKSLEMRLGIDLVNRKGRNVTLTRNGRLLSERTSEALDFLNSSLVQIRRNSQDRLSLASNVSVAQFWLTPRINEYLISRNAVPVTLTTSDRDADLFAQDADIIIYHGSDIPGGWDGAVLFEEIWLPVVAPEVMQGCENLASLKLLDFEKLTPKWINWQDFISTSQFDQFETMELVKLNSYGSSLDAALRGKGIALGCPDILQYEIDAGKLSPLHEFQIHSDQRYFVIWRAGYMTSHIQNLLAEMEIFV